MPDLVMVTMDEIAADVREGLFAVAVGTGLQVMGQLMAVDEKMLAGLSTRRYPVGLEPVGEAAEKPARSTTTRRSRASSSR